MEIVQDQNVNFGRLLRKQRVADGGPYRLLTYCVSLSVDAGLLVYNTLSCEMVLLQGDEVRDILSLPYLWLSTGFLFRRILTTGSLPDSIGIYTH